MAVDDQKYMSVIGFLVQIVDVFSDFIFAFQCKAYRDHLGDIGFEVAVQPEVFEWLYFLALVFVVGPYFLNLISSVNITRKIVADESMSEHSKQYFRAKTKVYAILVLMSGGAFPALKLMSSNLFGLGLFSAGLSNIQIEHFRGHHVVTTVRSSVSTIVLQSDTDLILYSVSGHAREWTAIGAPIRLHVQGMCFMEMLESPSVNPINSLFRCTLNSSICLRMSSSHRSSARFSTF